MRAHTQVGCDGFIRYCVLVDGLMFCNTLRWRDGEASVFGSGLPWVAVVFLSLARLLARPISRLLKLCTPVTSSCFAFWFWRR